MYEIVHQPLRGQHPVVHVHTGTTGAQNAQIPIVHPTRCGQGGTGFEIRRGKKVGPIHRFGCGPRARFEGVLVFYDIETGGILTNRVLVRVRVAAVEDNGQRYFALGDAVVG